MNAMNVSSDSDRDVSMSPRKLAQFQKKQLLESQRRNDRASNVGMMALRNQQRIVNYVVDATTRADTAAMQLIDDERNIAEEQTQVIRNNAQQQVQEQHNNINQEQAQMQRNIADDQVQRLADASREVLPPLTEVPRIGAEAAKIHVEMGQGMCMSITTPKTSVVQKASSSSSSSSSTPASSSSSSAAITKKEEKEEEGEKKKK
ncbi:unnamed protein product [Amoebophrya sp. A25]|nr:unnamed protein product [Amoebophrya sp. A25]|eukprot:GSA25T00019276001.1